MKTTLLAIALAQLGASSLHAVSIFTFNADPLNTTTGDPLPTSVSIDYAFLQTEDEFGDPLTTPFYAVDPSAPAVTASNPFDSGYGNPIDGNALDALLSPVMFTFATPFNITGFSAILDDSEFGTPDGFGAAIEFYDSTEMLVGSIAINQEVPLFEANGTGSYKGVSKIVFTSGAFYDNVKVEVPDGGATAALFAGSFLGLGLLHRKLRTA